MSKKKPKKPTNIIAENRRSRHDYFLEETFEAGLVLEGWEVKSLRAGKGQISESYVIIKKCEAWLLGAHIQPLDTASTHINPDPTRTRKLLLHQKQLSHLIGSVERKGYTIVPVEMHWHKSRAKLTIALAKGKQKHDKRQSEKDKDWRKEKAKIMIQ